MTTPTAINWKASTSEQRNDACACFMPPSDSNPLRNWWVEVDEPGVFKNGKQCIRTSGPLLVQSLAEAEDWLTKVRVSDETWIEVTGWARIYRESARIVERRRSVNYTGTPGGAWMLLEELMNRDCVITIRARIDATSVRAEQPMHDVPIVAFEGREPFAELAGMLFLNLNGVKIIQ